MNERDIRRHVRAIHEQIEEEHPDLELELFPYADGSLRSEAIDAHLRTCTRCAEDVRDLRGGAVVVRRRSRVPYLFLAAAVAAIVISTLLVSREGALPPPSWPGPPAARVPAAVPDEWAPLVRAARAGELPPKPAVLRAMPRANEMLRGGGAAAEPLAPSGVVVESQQPLLTWPDVDGDCIVSIFAGGEEVVRSARLEREQWTPPRPLRRGVTYSWEVRVEHGDSVRILPAPPAPPAVFHVLDGDAHAELERVRATRGGDHLLLALLYARAGLVGAALDEAGSVKDADRPVAERLRRELAAW